LIGGGAISSAIACDQKSKVTSKVVSVATALMTRLVSHVLETWATRI
jgi:hypothetical protein